MSPALQSQASRRNPPGVLVQGLSSGQNLSGNDGSVACPADRTGSWSCGPAPGPGPNASVGARAACPLYAAWARRHLLSLIQHIPASFRATATRAIPALERFRIRV